MARRSITTIGARDRPSSSATAGRCPRMLSQTRCFFSPLMLKTAANPGGLPIEVFDQLRAAVQADRSQFWKDLSMAFYGYNRPGAKISEGVRESFWLQGMLAGFPASYFCIKAFSETDT